MMRSALFSITMDHMTQSSVRFKDTGLSVGFLARGARASITDVPGVTVGHRTRIEGDSVRTGVTIIDPGVPDLFREKLPAAVYVGNGFGKMAGTTQIEELGTLETPIALTNTHSVGTVMSALIELTIESSPNMKPYETVNAVVGETNDGMLNAIHERSVTEADVRAAYDARTAEVAVGNVGAGTGTRAFSWKGGIGTSSRLLSIGKERYTLGVLVQTNFGGSLSMLGVPLGTLLGKDDYSQVRDEQPDGSCMIVVATDAPLSARQLKRIAKRAFLGIIRTGSVAAHGSGDYSVAFSTSRAGIEGVNDAGPCLSDRELSGFFLAAADATEEAVYDALFAAETMTGRDGYALEALPQAETLAHLMAARS